MILRPTGKKLRTRRGSDMHEVEIEVDDAAVPNPTITNRSYART